MWHPGDGERTTIGAIDRMARAINGLRRHDGATVRVLSGMKPLRTTARLHLVLYQPLGGAPTSWEAM